MNDMDADAIRVGVAGSLALQALGSPPQELPARTAAFDGQRAFTRAARSARLRFAVILLSKTMDREINKVRRPGWHLIHRGAVPLPLIGEGLSAL